MIKNDASRFFFETIRKYLTDFLPRVRNMSPNTIQAAKDSLNLLVDYCQKIRGITLLRIEFNTIGNVSFITDFLLWLRDERKCGDTTINQRLSCIRSFFRYAAYDDVAYVAHYQTLMTIPLRKVQKNKTIDFMPEETVKSILNAPDLKTRIGLRDAFYMTLLYDSAARSSEMLSLKVKDITDGKYPYMIVNGKGRKRRIIPLMQKTIEMFGHYLKHYCDDNITPDDYLFYTKRNGILFPMSSDNVSTFIIRYADQVRQSSSDVPKRVHPHMFRRSRAMHLYRNGMPLALLTEFLGHENPETTLIYASADTEMKRKAIENASSHLILGDESAVPVWDDNDEMIRRLYGLK
jgi:site-specific recombinase XerD